MQTALSDRQRGGGSVTSIKLVCNTCLHCLKGIVYLKFDMGMLHLGKKQVIMISMGYRSNPWSRSGNEICHTLIMRISIHKCDWHSGMQTNHNHDCRALYISPATLKDRLLSCTAVE